MIEIDFTKRPFPSPFTYYKERLQPLWSTIQNMHERGVRIDEDRLKKFREEAIETWAITEVKLQNKLGYIPNTKSHLDMKKLFDHLGIEYKPTPTNRASSKEAHMLLYAQQYPQARETLLDCLEITGQRQLLSQFLQPAIDEDGFYHPLYVLNATTTGRFAGKGALEGGPQIQNWPKMIRKMVIADREGFSLFQADLKQAEAMLVAWIANDPLLIEAFLNKKDIHRVRACIVFRNWRETRLPPDELLASIRLVCDVCASKGETECKESERQTAKIIGHSGNYEVGARKMATEVLPRAGIFLTEGDTKRIQDVILSQYVRKWWKDSKKVLDRSPIVYNAAGRYREFYGQLDNAMVRDYLAWQAQSVVGDITNAAMLKLQEIFDEHLNWQARIVTQTHDSLLVCARTEARFDVEAAFTKAFHHVLLFGDLITGKHLERKLTIPIDLAHGHSWGDQHENKKCKEYNCEYAIAA